MDLRAKKFVLESTGAKDIQDVELIQKLWSNYGDLLRVHLIGAKNQSVILKHIKLTSHSNHPKGFDGDLSHERKVNSYVVERNWYEKFNETNLATAGSKTAKLLKSFSDENESFILLEDLDSIGYKKRLETVSTAELELVIQWLASFHAKFLQFNPSGLWTYGTYWHLDTRPEELEALKDLNLKMVAPLLDQKLKRARYQTLLHGDAKLANFCFNNDSTAVAAVDFQYVGGGCGMKDLAYFVGSCLPEDLCEKLEEKILDTYFSHLLANITDESVKSDLEKEWRSLYRAAWADFHRFLKGWSPSHWKINSYSERVCTNVCDSILNDLSSTARTACLEAGELIMKYWQKEFKKFKKEGLTEAARIVTEVDRKSQDKILSILQLSIDAYDLGILSEENNDDKSRFEKGLFWCVDPLDGTLYFSEGKPGFSVTLALVEASGQPILGMVYDPISETLFHAIKGKGAFSNGKRVTQEFEDKKQILFADRSLKDSRHFPKIEQKFDVRISGGAALNAVHTLLYRKAFYFKFPKRELGGCAAWDLAAAHLIVEESGGSMTSFSGIPLSFNKKDSLYYNKEGILVCGDRYNSDELREILKEYI